MNWHSDTRPQVNVMFTTAEQNATDKQLIERSLAGNSDAFGQLVRKYQDQLFTGLRHVAGVHGDAEEITGRLRPGLLRVRDRLDYTSGGFLRTMTQEAAQVKRARPPKKS